MSDNKEKKTSTTDRIATVVDFFESGAAKVRFDGEDKASEKEYPYMKHCIPAKGDRVYMRAFAESYIIDGVILFETAPQKFDGIEGDFNVGGTLNAKKLNADEVSAQNLNISSTITTNYVDTNAIRCYNISANRNGISFFGQNISGRYRVDAIRSGSNTDTIINSFNWLLQVLRTYGLIS